MTRKGKYILAGLAAATLGLTAAGAIADRGGHWDGHHRGHHMGKGHGSGMGFLGFAVGGPHGKFCRADSAEFADIMLVRLEHRVKPTEAQKGSFEEFKAATRAAAAKLREACPKRPERTADGERPKRTPLERLTATQASLETSLEALKTYRPAAEKFYAELSDEQKSALERRGKRHGKWDRGHRRDRDRDERGPDREPDGPTPDDKG